MFNGFLQLFFNFFSQCLFDLCNDLWIGYIYRYLHFTNVSFNTRMNGNMRLTILHLGRYTSFFPSQSMLISVPCISSRIHTVPLAVPPYSQSINFPFLKTASPEARSVAAGALS